MITLLVLRRTSPPTVTFKLGASAVVPSVGNVMSESGPMTSRDALFAENVMLPDEVKFVTVNVFAMLAFDVIMLLVVDVGTVKVPAIV